MKTRVLRRAGWPVVSAAALVALAACQPQDASTGTDATQAAGGEVVFGTLVDRRDGFCLVGFTMTYPAETPQHSRQIRVSEALTTIADADYAIPVPPLGPPRNFTRNADGTVTFRGIGESSVAPCTQEGGTGRTLAIGPCASGACLPARFAPGPGAEQLGLRSGRY